MVKLVVADGPDHIVRGQSFVAHELRRPVIRIREAGALIEQSLQSENLFTHRDDICTGDIHTGHPGYGFGHTFPALGDIQDGEGDEQAVASAVNEGSRRLEGKRKLCFAFS